VKAIYLRFSRVIALAAPAWVLTMGLSVGYADDSVTEPPTPAAAPAPAAEIPAPVVTPPPVVADPQDPLATSIQALIKGGVHPRLRWGQFPDYQTRLEDLYQADVYRPVWSDGAKPLRQAQAVVDALGRIGERGLNAADYDAELLQKWLLELEAKPKISPQDLASFDVAVSLSLMRCASNLYVGRINPRNVNFGLNIEPKKLDLPGLIRKAAHDDRPEDVIVGLEPKLTLYENLKVALARYQTLAKQPQPPEFKFPPKFKPGGHHEQIPALRKLLVALGDSTDDPLNPSDTYDASLVDAVKNLQRRHGLTANGVIGATTQAELNIPISDRVKQIQLGMERMRWLPEQIPGPYLIVNIPSFELFGFKSGSEKPDLQMNVIVGESINERNTPVFSADMTYVNFRPYWNVPISIITKEVIPLLSKNPGGYLSRNNMEIVSNFSPNAAALEPSQGNIRMLATGALKLRQKPGPKNALGLVKFSFPNNNNVYMHSTPSQGLFKKIRRDFSHGCIRLEYPVVLAEWVLRDQLGWSRDKIQGIMKGDKTRTVTLDTPLPVYIFYSTVLADEFGKVMFYNDIYGHDLTLQALLAKGFPYPG
jgi:L,D-transpeptidase YcbB